MGIDKHFLGYTTFIRKDIRKRLSLSYNYIFVNTANKIPSELETGDIGKTLTFTICAICAEFHAPIVAISFFYICKNKLIYSRNYFLSH